MIDYRKTAKAYAKCTDVNKVFAILDHLLNQEKCLDRDMAIILIGKCITMHTAENKIDTEKDMLYTDDIYHRIWDGTQSLLQDLGEIENSYKLVKDWLNGVEITLD